MGLPNDHISWIIRDPPLGVDFAFCVSSRSFIAFICLSVLIRLAVCLYKKSKIKYLHEVSD